MSIRWTGKSEADAKNYLLMNQRDIANLTAKHGADWAA